MLSIIEKYNNLPLGLKATFWTITSSVCIKGISFITLPIFTRILTTSDYGILAIYNSWTCITSILITFTVWGGVFNVGMIKYPKRTEFISAIQGLSVSCTLFAFFVALFFIDSLSNLLGLSKFLVCCMFLEILFSIPFNIWFGVQVYDFLYRKRIALTVFISILNPLLGYIAIVSFSPPVEAKVLSGLIPQFVLGGYFFVKQQLIGKTFFEKKIWKKVFVFNSVLVIHYLSLKILNQSDRIMINSLCDSSKAGIYSVAYNFSLLLCIFSNGINSSLTPYIYKHMRSNDTSKIAFINNVAAICVGLCSIVLICIIPFVFRFILPPSYHEAIWIIPPVTLAAYFMFLYPMFGAVEYYFSEKYYVTLISFVGAVVNIILNLIFIRIFGYMAAAYTTLFCYIGFSCAHFWVMKKILKRNNFKAVIFDGNSILLISIFTSVLCFIILFFYDNPLYCCLIVMFCMFFCYLKRKYFTNLIQLILKKEIV